MWTRRHLLAGAGAAAALPWIVGASPAGSGRRLLAVLAPGGWDPTFVVDPKLGVEGVDVANRKVQLADDFLCQQSGPITDFHLWGSFYGDRLPPNGPGSLRIALYLYSDVPARPDKAHSHPGTLLWSRVFNPGEYRAARVFTQREGEWWYDPLTRQWQRAADTEIYQFDFYVRPEEAFRQVEGTVYWLGVKYLADPEDRFDFGWKTTYEPWNDAACWLDDQTQPPAWMPLSYGDGHPWAEMPDNTLHLAFAISGEPGAVVDFGDAPDPTYPTLLASNGARHNVVPGLMLGRTVDVEANGQPNAGATGDDDNPPAGPDDEDGVILPVLVPGQTDSATVTVTGNGLLSAWVDFGADGSWADPGDQIFTNVSLTTGTHTLFFNVPGTAKWGAGTFARFRFSTQRDLTFTGAASDGEVEDALVYIHPLPNSDLGDAPDSSNFSGLPMTAYPRGGPPGVIANYPTVFGVGAPPGPMHVNARAVFLGPASSGEMEADRFADEDLINNLLTAIDKPDGDEGDDGLLPGTVLPHCAPGHLQVSLSWPPGPVLPPAMLINVWCDWNRDGDWNDTITCPDGNPAPEWAGRNIGVLPGTPTMAIPITRAWHPSTAQEPIWIRITLSEMPVPGPQGFGGAGGDGPPLGYQFGETEDYYLREYENPLAFDFGDAPTPYPTLMANNGARHVLVPGFMLGLYLDFEINGLPDPLALGDDRDNQADEDGVRFTTPLLVNRQACVDVFLTGPVGGKLDGWIDFNKNGTWEPAERIFNAQVLNPGLNAGLCFQVPVQSALGTNNARFRLSSVGGLPPDGPAPDGEVEDYQVLIHQRRPATNTVVGWIGVTNATPSNQVVTLRWNAETNTHYEVLSAPDLGTNSGSGLQWQAISPIIIGPANQFNHTNNGGGHRFYRIHVPSVYP